MSEAIISPGVFQIETDQSLYTQGPQTIGAALVGPTVGGLPFVPTYVTTYNQYLSIFGDIFQSGSYYYEYFTSMAAKEYFQNGGQTLLVTRIISGSNNASTYATSNVNNAGAVASASIDFDTLAADSQTFAVTGSSNGITANSIATFYVTSSTTQVDTTTAKYIVTGSSKTATINNIINKFVSTAATFGITAVRGDGNYINFTANYGGTVGNSFKVSSTTFAGGSATGVTSVVLETLAWGNQMNNTSTETNGALASGSSQNVRWEVTNRDVNKGTFTLVIRRGDDNNAQKNILETWTNLSLDPQLPNYVARVIGDLKPYFDGTTIQFSGNYTNISKYVRVKSVYATPNSILNTGKYDTNLSGYLPKVGSGSFAGGVADTTAAKLMNESITTSNIQGFAPADYNTAFTILSNSDDYRFNVLLAPGVTLDNGAVSTMISICEGRGDAIAVVDTKAYGNVVSSAAGAAAGQSSNYAATYWPWIQLYSSGLGKAVWSPASTVIGGVYAFNDQIGAEWFAPAGLNRGGVPSVLKYH